MQKVLRAIFRTLKMRNLLRPDISCICKSVLKFCLLFLGLWPIRSGLPARQNVVMQIIMPHLSAVEDKLKNAHLVAKETINHGRELQYRELRSKFIVDSWLNFTDSKAPSEILSLFCSEVFSRNVNTVMSLNYESHTVMSNDYILQLAAHLGYPVISWDPFFPGALQSEEDSRVLQIAPTIYHQCQAMTRLLSRYNWTEFSIVTTKISSHMDFIGCMRDMIKRTSVKQGFIMKAKFKMLATIIIDIDELDDWSVIDAKISRSLQTVIQTVTRVILLHAGPGEAKSILDTAEDMQLTEAKYMWLLTSSSVGSVRSKFASSSYPIGVLGVMYNDSGPVIQEALKTSIRIWGLGLNKIAMSPSRLQKMKIYPSNSCNATGKPLFWTDGKELYRAMKSVVIDDPPVSFTDNGIIENVELNLYNVRPGPIVRHSRRKKWELVGRVVPKRINNRVDLEVEMDEIVWPGGAVSPPKGKPEKRFFKIVTLKESPYVMYVPPDSETGVCGPHSVSCKLQGYDTEGKKLDYGNATIDSNGLVHYCCNGMCVDLLKVLADRMHFDFDMYEVEDRKWGSQDNLTGKWNGLIKDMVEHKADMVITSIKINHERASAMAFSVPFLETGITIIVSIRKGAISATAFLEPFDLGTWLFILLLAIHAVSVSIYITEWFSPNGINRGQPPVPEPYDYPSWCLILVFSVHAMGASIFIFEWLSPSGLNKGKTSLREHKFSLFRSFWLIWAMLFGAAVSTDNPRGTSSRFMANVWALFALVFLASYTANLAAFMITIDEYYDLSGIQDWRLMNPTAVTPHFKFATVPDGSTEDNLSKNYPRMHQYMKKYNKTTVELGIEALKRQEIHAFIYDATVLEYNAGRDPECDLITVGKWYAMTGYGVGFPFKRSPLIDEVDAILLELQNNGEIEKLQKFWLSGACHAQKDKKDKTSHNIGILNFTSAFILLAVGVMLGALIMILEHFYFKFGRKCLKKYDRHGCCALVSLSMGKSLTFEQSVMDAIDMHRHHKCKDAICESQLWKAKHELDLALIKIDRLRTELARIGTDEAMTSEDTKTVVLTGVNSHSKHIGIQPEAHYDVPASIHQRNVNHIDQDTPHIINELAANKQALSVDNKAFDIELSDLEKRRLQFRRSPSYTNAMSTDSDGKDGGKTSANSACVKDTSPKRCPSYSHAVENSPMLDFKPDSTKQQTRTKFHDGKFYVGVALDNDESAL